MSNFLAIATATETFRQAIEAALKKDLGDEATASAIRPVAPGGAAPAGLPTLGANLYLYQVLPNAALRNSDLPSRRGDGVLVQRPRVPLNLHYLVTFYGKESDLEPQRALGSVVRAINSFPVLTQDMIRVAQNTLPFLKPSDLADESERVRCTLLPFSLEELSKIWSVFFQSPYILSLVYEASVVVVEGQESPQPAIPVRSRSIHVLPFQAPVIEQVSPQVVQTGATLTITGKDLKSDITKVKFGGAPLADPSELAAIRIVVAVPSGLPAGIQTVQILHLLDLGTGSPAEPHRGFESNVVPFMLAPKITTALPDMPLTKVKHATTFTLAVDPPVNRFQKAELLLGSSTIARTAPAVATPTVNLDFAIPADFPLGPTLVRVRIDGAESPLLVDTNSANPTFNQYIGPAVEII